MELVAWIAVCKFQCKLEGGFVRDWIVAGYSTPPSNPGQWIDYKPNRSGQLIPMIRREVVPTDLDCHLPLHIRFDMDRFQDQLYKFGFECKVYREDWRYVLLIDEKAPTGPFTMDLIEPHVALTHDRIDFDVSNLSLEKDYPREVGMRIDITQSPYCIQMETIVENILHKRFQVLRPIDWLVQDRIDKMVQRGWTETGIRLNYIPPPPVKYHAVLAPLPPASTLYKALEQTMKSKISASVQILSIEEIRNPLLQDTYEAMKKVIARECPRHDPNERELFHGTKNVAVAGIVEIGFDDRRALSDRAWGECNLRSTHFVMASNV